AFGRLFKDNSENKSKNEVNEAKKVVDKNVVNQKTPTKESKQDPVSLMKSVQPKNIEQLKAEYKEKGLDQLPDTFVLYRIIGNDLYPRHKKGQSRENLQFILENEPQLDGCEKRWVVNRIIDKDEERAIIELLKKHNQE